MERYDLDGRTILDDTAFDVASMLPHHNMVAVYAVRGRRGVDVNRRNAHALADICNVYGVDPLIVTAASDRAGEKDVPTADEVDATRQVLVDRGRRFVWHDGLADALKEALNRTSPGDLIVLVGAQGMNEAKEILNAEC
jgi:UDP-N-acetylmuramoyl-L-alanyl-D-glutamate--2,6-diaminopimelate ligase